MLIWFILFLLALAVAVTVLVFVMKSLLSRQQDPQQLEKIINQIYGATAQKITEQTKQVLEGERAAIHVDLENKQQSMQKLVETLHAEIKDRQLEIRSMEQDRNKKFGEITLSLENHRKLADELRVSTQQLAAVLSNNQARGEWGERIIEDLMKNNGLIEGVHYQRQTSISPTLKPDILLLLPNKHTVAVDVKFPYSEIQKMSTAESKVAKDQHMKQFSQDVRLKISKVAEYIRPELHTMEYAILFVPNEMIFSFMNQKFPDLIDEAMAKRVIIVSPFTFLIVARTVIESYRNFMIEDKLRDIIQYVGEFVNEWGVYQEELGKFGHSIETLEKGYEKLTTTRARQLSRKIQKIEEYRQGTLEKPSEATPIELTP